MDDPELKKIIQKVIFAVAVAIVFAVPVFFIFKNKLLVEESSVLKDIRNDKTFILYITKDNCKICKTLQKELDNKDIEYEVLNRNKNKDYNEIIRNLGLTNSKLEEPALIYIEKGETISYIVDIKDKEYLNEYLENYK